jgi:hypothetical protein
VLSKHGADADKARDLLAQSFGAVTQPSFYLVPRGNAMASQADFTAGYDAWRRPRGISQTLAYGGSRTRPLWLTWAFYAARSYSLREVAEDGSALNPHLGEISDRVIGYGQVELAFAMRSSAVAAGLVLG